MKFLIYLLVTIALVLFSVRADMGAAAIALQKSVQAHKVVDHQQ